MMRRLSLAAALATVACIGAPASAQEPEGDPPPPEYDELVREALSESAAGRFEEARVLFRRAHQLFPNARTLRGIGMVAFEVRDYPDAIRSLSRAIADARRPLTEEQLAEAHALLERAHAFVGRYDVSAIPEGARVLVDGHPAEIEPDGTILLPVGAHEVVVRTAARAWEGRVTVRGGEREPLPIVLDVAEPLARPEPAPPLAAPRAPLDTTPPAIVLTTGIALAAVGAALLAAGLVDVANVEGAEAGTAWSSLAGAYERAAPLTGTGAVSIALGGAAALAGGVWLGVGSAEGAQISLGARVEATW